MKFKFRFFATTFTLLFFSCVIGQDIESQLKHIFGEQNVISVDSSGYKEYFQIEVPQMVDHNDQSKGTFLQSVLLGIQSPNATTVMETEGYNIDNHEKDPKYKSELATLLNANQIIVEHRFFGSSIPDTVSKKFLTYEQAGEDDHYITQKLRNILHGKWVSTGLSKSGDAALAYRYFYPNDVDATVVFGISLTTVAEDPRIEAFMKEKRKTVEGEKINQAQLYLLENKKKLLPVFQQILDFNHADLSNWDLETLYDYSILELEHIFLQYYTSYEDLKNQINPRVDEQLERGGFTLIKPLENFEDRLVFYLAYLTIGNIDKGIKSHYYQAFSQGGYYGYDETPFLKYLKLKDYPLNVFAGEPTKFDPSFRQGEKKYTETTMTKVIFINGGNDPWTVAKINPSKIQDNLQIVAPHGNHTLTLKQLPKEDYNSVMEKLNQWLDVNLKAK